MRTFTDNRTGTIYDLTIGRESYGMLVVLFFPRNGGQVLKSLLESDTRLEAQAELENLDQAGLNRHLEKAMSWESTGFSG